MSLSTIRVTHFVISCLDNWKNNFYAREIKKAIGLPQGNAESLLAKEIAGFASANVLDYFFMQELGKDMKVALPKNEVISTLT